MVNVKEIPGEIVKIIVPTYNRFEPGLVTTHKVIANCRFVVREEQAELYRKNYPGIEIIPIPKEAGVKNISDTRQWIIENLGNIIMFDDDITSIKRALVPAAYSNMRITNPDSDESATVTDPMVMYEVVQQLGQLCKDLKCYLFGFTASMKPLDCKEHQPFKSNKYINATTFGVMAGEEGCKISFPPEEDGALGEDYYAILKNAFHHRFSIVDNRFIFASDTFGRTGGIGGYRSLEREKAAYYYLKKKFGNAVQKKGDVRNIKGELIQKTHEYERVLNIPY